MTSTFRLALVAALAIGFGTARADAATVHFTVPLSGANEIPAGSGDPDGSGTAMLTFDSVALTVSWSITTNNIQLPIFLDHIHQGAAGANGPVVIDFSSQLVGGPIVDPDVAAVLANPSGYYVNVHTNEFQAGAIRGQLGAPSPVPALGEVGRLALGIALVGAGLLGLARRSHPGEAAPS